MKRHFQLWLFKAAALLFACAATASEPDWREVIRTKEKTVPFGKHTLLTADTVELEFRMDPTKVGQTVDWRGPDSRSVSQQIGMGSGLKLGTSSSLTHEFLFGASQETVWSDPVFGQQESQRFQQRQITTLQTMPTEKSRLSLTNELVNEQTGETAGGTQNWKQGASFEYRLPLGIGVRPQYVHETFRDELLRETQRNSAYLSLGKDLVPSRLNLQVQPGVATEDQFYEGGQRSEAGKLDLNLSWKPDASTEWIWGAQAQQTDRLQEMSQEQMRSLYSQLSYHLWSDLALRLRGDLQRTEKIQDGLGLTSDESNMNLNFGPSMKLSDSISAGAELGYRHRYDHSTSGQSNEQTLSLSIKGTF